MPRNPIDVSSETEKALLGVILQFPEYYDKALNAGILPEMFPTPVCRATWDTIVELFAGKHEIGDELIPAVMSKMRIAHEGQWNPIVEINAMTDAAPTPVQFKMYVESLHFLYRVRMRRRAVESLHEYARKKVRTDEEQRELLREPIEQLIALQHPIVTESFEDRMQREWERLETCYQTGKDPVRTYSWNVPGLDNAPIFAPAVSELTVIGARPSTGKSSLVRQMAESIFDKTNPDKGIRIIFTKEVQDMDWCKQMAASMSGIDTNRMELWTQNDHDKYKKWYFWVVEAVKKKLLIVRHDMKTVEDVDRYVRNVAKNVGQVSYVAVDYLQQYVSKKAKSRDEAIGDTCCILKDLAMDLKIPVVLPCQLNRDFEKDNKGEKKVRAPVMSDLRESGNIEQAADKIVFLWLPNDTNNLVGRNGYEVRMTKRKDRNRNMYAEVSLCFHKQVRRFEYLGVMTS